MAIPKQKLAALCLSVLFITGCASVKVIRNPDESDTGIRYYRPKPYLLVTPADPTGRLVNLKLEYLPDFNEEYSVHPRGKTSIALKDGWNLVGVNTKEAPKEEEKPPAKIEDIKLPPAVVAATNVPIGYYESVYGMAGNRKFLQGWRYIGMTLLGGGQPNVCRVPGHSPNCPSDAGTSGGAPNGCISGPLHGLVFFNGVMTFRQLDEIANNQLCPMYVNPAPGVVTTAVPSKIESNTPNQSPQLESTTPAPVVAPKLEGATPPVPSTAPPAPGSASLSRPKVTPALVVAKPAASPKLAKGTAPAPVAGSSASQLAASQASYAPIAKKPSSMPPLVSVDPIKTTPAKSGVAGSTSLDQDPLMGMPPGLDQDLFRTGTSPRP